jgi:hypothetical protein
VLRLSEKLVDFSARCGQPGAMHDLAYFLSKPGALPRVPHLLLISKSSALNVEDPGLDELLGTLLIFEQHVSGFGAGRVCHQRPLGAQQSDRKARRPLAGCRAGARARCWTGERT